MNDRERFLELLEQRGPVGVHSHEVRKLGISGNPSQRVAELREDGHQVDVERENVGRRPGVRYTLVAETGAVADDGGADLGEARGATICEPGFAQLFEVPAPAPQSAINDELEAA